MAGIAERQDGQLTSLTAEQALAGLIEAGKYASMAGVLRPMMLEVLNEILSLGVVMVHVSNKQDYYADINRGLIDCRLGSKACVVRIHWTLFEYHFMGFIPGQNQSLFYMNSVNLATLKSEHKRVDVLSAMLDQPIT